MDHPVQGRYPLFWVCGLSLSHLEADAEGEGKRDDDDDPRDAGQEKSAQPDAADAGFGFVG